MRRRQSVNLPSLLSLLPHLASLGLLSAQPLGRAVTLIVSTYGALAHRNASLLYLLQAIMLAHGNVRNVEFDWGPVQKSCFRFQKQELWPDVSYYDVALSMVPPQWRYIRGPHIRGRGQYSSIRRPKGSGQKLSAGNTQHIIHHTVYNMATGPPVWNAMYMRFFMSPHTYFVQCPSFDWCRKNVQSNLRSKAGAPSSIIRNIQWILSIPFCSLTRTEGEKNWWRKGRLMC